MSGSQVRPFVPASLREKIIKAYHCIDHPGQAESVRRAANQYFWPKMKKQIKEFVKTCHCCQSTKPSKLKSPHTGHFPDPQKRFSHIHIDVCGPLPESGGYKFCCPSSVDRLGTSMQFQ